MKVIKDLEFETKPNSKDKEDTIHVAHTKSGRITVLDRITGYGNGIRDIETGFKDLDGKFWLVTGMFDIRKYGKDLSVSEAIAMIKDRANACVGV